MNLKLNVVRFNNEDVIATSCLYPTATFHVKFTKNPSYGLPDEEQYLVEEHAYCPICEGYYPFGDDEIEQSPEKPDMLDLEKWYVSEDLRAFEPCNGDSHDFSKKCTTVEHHVGL